MQSGTELNVMGGYYCVPKVEVVIKIPQDDLQILRHKYSKGAYRASTIEQALVETILNGTVLPKGHDRLIETDKLISHLKAHKDLLVRHYADEGGNIPFEINSRIDQIRICMDDVANAPTIIEADTESEE